MANRYGSYSSGPTPTSPTGTAPAEPDKFDEKALDEIRSVLTKKFVAANPLKGRVKAIIDVLHAPLPASLKRFGKAVPARYPNSAKLLEPELVLAVASEICADLIRTDVKSGSLANPMQQPTRELEAGKIVSRTLVQLADPLASANVIVLLGENALGTINPVPPCVQSGRVAQTIERGLSTASGASKSAKLSAKFGGLKIALMALLVTTGIFWLVAKGALIVDLSGVVLIVALAILVLILFLWWKKKSLMLVTVGLVGFLLFLGCTFLASNLVKTNHVGSSPSATVPQDVTASNKKSKNMIETLANDVAYCEKVANDPTKTKAQRAAGFNAFLCAVKVPHASDGGWLDLSPHPGSDREVECDFFAASTATMGPVPADCSSK